MSILHDTMSRRSVFSRAGQVTLSAAGLALLTNTSGVAFAGDTGTAGDISILNTALALEHEGIMAYQIGAESGLLSKAVLPVAIAFQGHHKEHREVLVRTIETLGGKPVGEMSRSHYEASLQVSKLKNQADVLDLAARLELGAVNAYISVMEGFHTKGLATAAAQLIADETMHWTVLSQALQQPLPEKAFAFG